MRERPGKCDSGRAGSGANAVLVSDSDVSPLEAPEEGETRLDDVTAINLAATGEDVLGQLGGEPAWVQHPETPDCPECGGAMAFAAQLEEHSSINFGGAGAGYVFRCKPCDRGAFLFQC